MSTEHRRTTDAHTRDSTLYEFYGRTIESDLSLSPLLSPSRNGEGRTSVRVYRAAGSSAGERATVVYDAIDRFGERIFRLQRTGTGYTWWYPDLATFILTADGAEVRWTPETAIEADIAAALGGPVLGFALQLQGLLGLHGAAVAAHGNALAFSAPSRFGKSTLAAALMRRGCALLSDSMVALEAGGEDVRVLPGPPRFKISPKSLRRLQGTDTWPAAPSLASWLDKRVVDARQIGSVCDKPAPLAAAYILAPQPADSRIEVQRFDGREALLALIANAYNASLTTQEPDLQARQWDVFERIIRQAPVFAIRCPRSLDRIEEIATAILASSEVGSVA